MTLTYGSGKFLGNLTDITALLNLKFRLVLDFLSSRYTLEGLSRIPVNFNVSTG